jgi:hypothetical protein
MPAMQYQTMKITISVSMQETIREIKKALITSFILPKI